MAASKRAAERTDHINSMSKYDGPPLERSESMLEAAERVDGLKETIKHKAERAKRHGGVAIKESSPCRSPHRHWSCRPPRT